MRRARGVHRWIRVLGAWAERGREGRRERVSLPVSAAPPCRALVLSPRIIIYHTSYIHHHKSIHHHISSWVTQRW
ncbi:hypothetical protein BDZ94DRAFT_152262 [Collybia nuda]|uniref:Uncharacterized protein n=1 Tax=Collybia nuda TaxID=64659 RepID=A0A9P5XYJ7_9AGAR|nr:hypothetical protein BDZ94DRAFT_152262 [Collybia nuda]